MIKKIEAERFVEGFGDNNSYGVDVVVTLADGQTGAFPVLFAASDFAGKSGDDSAKLVQDLIVNTLQVLSFVSDWVSK